MSIIDQVAPQVLKISHLGFSYNGSSKQVLHGLDLELNRGDFCLLVGTNGSGKSTCLRLLKPEVSPAGTRQGSVSVCGFAPEHMSVSQSASTIGYVSQAPAAQLVCDVVWHEIAFGLEQLGTPAPEMRRRVAQVASFLGIEPLMERPCDSLSGGQAQLVALAAAAVMEPALLLLDEPTSMLDPVAADNFAHALFRLTRRLGMCALVATHTSHTLAPYATCAYELTDGSCKPRDLAQLQTVPPLLPLSADKNHAFETFVQAAWPSEASSDCNERTNCNDDTNCKERTEHVASTAPAAQPTRATRTVHQGETQCRESADRRERVRTLWTDELWFRYGRREAWALKGVSLSIYQGTCVCILGGNGSGKSTLLASAAGMLKPQIGRWHQKKSHSSHKLNLPREQTDVGYLPQEPELLLGAASVWAELTGQYGTKMYSIPADMNGILAATTHTNSEFSQRECEAAALVKLFGLETLLGTDPLDLSGGQRQVLALAKVLLQHALLLLLDEPTQGLDTQTRAAVAALLLEARERGTAIVCATHDTQFAQLVATDVTFMFAGEVASTLPAEEYFEKSVFFGTPVD